MKKPWLAFIVGLAAVLVSLNSAAQMSGMGAGRRSHSTDSTSTAGAGTVTGPAARLHGLSDKLYDMRVRLVITPEQSAAWDSFADKTMAWGELVYRSTGASDSPQPVLDAVQDRLYAAKKRAAQMQALVDATQKLYALLSADQKQTADTYLAAVIP